MITLHIEGNTIHEVIEKTYAVLKNYNNTVDAKTLEAVKEMASAAPPLIDIPVASPAAPPAVPATPSTEVRKRGRPRSTPPGGVCPPAAPTAPPAAPTAPPAAPPAAPPVAPPAAPLSDVTYDQVKSALQKLAENRPNESGTAGLERARALIAKYGYRKVKEIKPEHFKNILDECQAGV